VHISVIANPLPWMKNMVPKAAAPMPAQSAFAVQTCCMRILLLAPIYALVSWCMMVFLPIAPFLEAIRDLYESYTLYCFWVMLVLWCGGQRRVIEVVGRNGALNCSLCPLLQPCHLGLPVFRFGNSSHLFRCATIPLPSIEGRWFILTQ
jgi:hypothetical protein